MTKMLLLILAALLNADNAFADCSCFCKVKFTDPASMFTGSTFGLAHIDYSPLVTWGNCTVNHGAKKAECWQKCDQKAFGDANFNSMEWWCKKLGKFESGYKGGSARAYYAIGTDNYTYTASKGPIDCPKPRTSTK